MASTVATFGVRATITERIKDMGAHSESSWTEQFWRSATGGTSTSATPCRTEISRLVGAARIRGALADLVSQVRESIESVNPYVPSPETLRRSLPVERAILERGIRARSILPVAARESIDVLRHARETSRLGAKTRTGPVDRFRSIILDGRVAVVSEVEGRAGATGEALIIRSESLAALLSAQFESLWLRSTDLGAAQEPDGEITVRDGLVLRGLVRGLRNRQIAQEAGCSVATVQRTVATYRERWSAPSRSALAIEAARRGWGVTPRS